VNRLNTIQKDEATHMYGDENMRYAQDPYLKEMGIKQLAGTHLLGNFSIDSQADRFRDLLLTSASAGF